MMKSSQVRGSKNRKWTRIAIFVGVLLLIGGYLWLFGFQNAMAIEVHYSLRNMPVVRMIPVTLADRTQTAAKGTDLRYFGYGFEVPWEDLDTDRIKLGKARVVLPFRSGVLVSFLNSSNHEFVDGLAENSHVKPEALKLVYGAGAMQTDYDFYKMMLYKTPDVVRPFGSRKDVVAGMMLMIIKGIAIPEESGIFEVNTSEFHGFQYGDVQKHPKRIVVSLYSHDQGVEIVLLRQDRQPLQLSQSDINRLIQTLHRLDPIAGTTNNHS